MLEPSPQNMKRTNMFGKIGLGIAIIVTIVYGLNQYLKEGYHAQAVGMFFGRFFTMFVIGLIVSVIIILITKKRKELWDITFRAMGIVALLGLISLFISITSHSAGKKELTELKEIFSNAQSISEIRTAYGTVTVAAQDDAVSYEEYVKVLDEFISIIKNIANNANDENLNESLILFEKASSEYKKGIANNYDEKTIYEAYQTITRAEEKLNIYFINVFPGLEGIPTELSDDQRGDTIELEERYLFSERVKMLIPKSFKIMSDEMKAFKYPSERRPPLVYTNSTASVNIAFNHTTNKATQESLPSYHEELISTFRNTFSSATWYDRGIKEINGQDVGYIELLTPAIDTKIYNLIFFTDLDGKLLITTFNCTNEEMETWKPIAKQIMHSLKILQ